MNWDNLRHAVAVARHGSLSGAARALSSSAQTVGRRIAALEAALGVALFVRHAGGYRPTPDGAALFAEAEQVETAMASLRARATSLSGDVAGLVRVAAPETIATHLLLPALRPLLQTHPHLQIELISGVELVGMTRGEADIALRLLRPEHGALTVRQVGVMAQALYGATEQNHDLATARIIGWPAGIDLSVARWLRSYAGREPDLRFNHLAAHEAAIRAGLGIGVLPDFLARGLCRIDGPLPPPEPLWLIAQDTDTPAERVRVVYDEIMQIIMRAAPRLSSQA